MSKSKSKAIAPVAGNPVVDPAEFQPVKPAVSFDALVEVADPDAFVRSVADGFQCEKVMSIPIGGQIVGIYDGPGPDVEITRANGEVVNVHTHRVKHKSGVTACVMGGAQLDKTMPTFELGTEVRIIKLGQVETKGGNRVNDYAIASRRPALPPDASSR